MAGKRTTRHDPASHLHAASARWGGTSYKNAPTKSVSVGGTRFVYRELGIDTGVPVIFLNHLAANLDNWDPRVVDGIAAKHRVITFDNRGVGGSEGKTPDTVEAMAHDAVAFIRALGFDQVDLLGFSLGGMVSQVIAQQEPALVRKIILAGTGPCRRRRHRRRDETDLPRHVPRIRHLQGSQGTSLLHQNGPRQVGGEARSSSG